MKKRIFFGLPVPIDVTQIIFNQIKESYPKIDDRVRWTRPENWHVTLRFIGDATNDEIQSICQEVEKGVQGAFSKFNLNIKVIDHFPHSGSRIIAALMPANEPILKLHQIVEQSIQILDVKPDNRPLRPHITIARRHPNTSFSIKPIPIPPIELPVNELILYHSKPAEKGNDYIPIARFSLSNLL